VAPGGVYIGGGPVYVIPAPSNGNGTYVEPTAYGYGVPEPTPYLAPTVVAPGAGYVAAFWTWMVGPKKAKEIFFRKGST